MIILDIETVALGDPPEKKPFVFKIPKNYKSEEVIKKYTEENGKKQESEYEETYLKELESFKSGALKATKSKIVCIVAVDTETGNEFSIATNDERKLLHEFSNWLLNVDKNSSQSIIFCGHNVRFDLQMLYTHMIKYQLGIRDIIPHERFSKNILCTMESWAGARFDDRTSLKDIAKYLDIEDENKDVDGSDIYDMYIKGDYEGIKNKCKNDIKITIQLSKKLYGE